MSYIDRVGTQLKAIGQRLGSPLVLDNRGTLVLTYGDGRLCTLAVMDATEEVVMFTAVAPVHDAARKSMFEASLHYNLGDGRAHDDFLGYDGDRRQLVLTSSLHHSDPSVEDLSEAIGAFLKSALAVRKELDDAVRAHNPDGPSTLGADAYRL